MLTANTHKREAHMRVDPQCRNFVRTQGTVGFGIYLTFFRHSGQAKIPTNRKRKLEE